MPGDGRLRLLVCHDDPAMQWAIAVAAERAGFDVVGVVTQGADVIDAVARHRPDALVLDVALTGVVGLAILGQLSQAAPRCAAILMSPFEALHEAARSAGAYDVVAASDVRQLARSLRELHESAHAGCTCADTPSVSGTSSTFDQGSSSVRFEMGRKIAGNEPYGNTSEDPPEE